MRVAALPGTASRAGAVSRVRVAVAGHRAAVALGADGLVLSVARADGGASPGRVRVRVSYRGFASAFGGGFGPRLQIFSLPPCALATPAKRACRVMTPVWAVNDWRTRTVTATVTVPGVSGQPAVLALSSTTSGGSGDFKATSLTSASSWNVGAQTGDFTWSYPLRMPPAIGGAAPSLALSYDSGSTDGETALGNSQPGQLGEGFSLSGQVGYIERKYVSCGDLIKGKITGSVNNTGQSAATGDQCWDGYNGYLSLGGHSGQLIYQSSDQSWHLAGDDGSTVHYLRGGSNGSYNNTYWEIITPDGTQYWFGLSQLPGYQSGNSVTNSVWTMPVVGLGSGDPGNTPGSYMGSVTPNMAWRWNLDLVVDRNGNATSYFYSPQVNYYAVGSTGPGTGTPMSYDAGGTLSSIWYGSQDVSSGSPSSGGNVYAHKPLHVALSYSDRCTTYLTNDAACQSHENETDGYWPDTPWDLYCHSASSCTTGQPTDAGHDAPSFFETQMLTGVTTSVNEGGSSYQSVDTWTLGYTWQQNTDVNWDLTMASVTRAGDVGGSLALDPVSFNWTTMANRVPYDTPTYPAMSRARIYQVLSETGATTTVTYNAGSCASSPPSDPRLNTLPCFLQKWDPGDLGGGDPVTSSWFYKYTVAGVQNEDSTTPLVGREPPLVSSYVYCDTTSPSCTANANGSGGAWHYDTAIDLAQPKYKSYSQWRGYQYVHVITGATAGTQSETDYTFLRGMDQDPIQPGGGFSSASVTPTRTVSNQPSPITDADALNGFQLEAISYDGLNTASQVSDVISWPWTSVTATSATQPWGGTLTSALTGTAQTDTYTPLASGSTRHTQVQNTFNGTTGLIKTTDDVGDVSLKGTAGDQQLCTTYTYPSPASSAGLISFPQEVQATACGQPGSPTVSDTQYSYDGLAFGTAPTAGNVTETDKYSSADPGVADHWAKISRDTYDSYGRLATSKDPSGNVTTTTCTAFGAGLPARTVAVQSPLTSGSTPTYATTSTDVNPAWGLPNATTDANNEVTSYQYDALGRVTKAWLPAEQPTTSPASYKYSYNPSDTTASSVTTQRLTGIASQQHYFTTVQLYDALLRPRQVQASSPDPNEQVTGMAVTDTYYDTRGNVITQAGPYNVTNNPPSASLWLASSSLTQTTSAYDGAGRITEKDQNSGTTTLWKTTWQYPGSDKVIEYPPHGGTTPPGGTVTATWTDARGRTTETDQYQSPTSATGPHDATTYAYTPAGQLAQITDTAGNTWSYSYDLLGRQVSATTPDTGTTTSSWGDRSLEQWSTDGAGKTLTWQYDAASRRTGEFNTTGGAQPSSSNQVIGWTYDTPAVGQLSAATAYDAGGAQYTETVNSYDPSYQPTKTTYTIPIRAVTGGTGGLGGTYAVTATYNPDGSLKTQGYPALGSLPAETVAYGYDGLGNPDASTGLAGYVVGAFYTYTGQPAETTLGTAFSGVNWTKIDYAYDPATLRLATTTFSRELTGPNGATWATDSNISYGYDGAGNILSAADSATGDNRCYQYDYLSRLTAAWAQPTAACPAQAPGKTGLGGPAAYEQTLTYDSSGTANGSSGGTTGNITATTMITGSGAGATTTTTTTAYPAAGTTQPHAAATANGGAPAGGSTYNWNPDGTLAAITGTGAQANSWGAQAMVPGQLTSTTTGNTTTSYRYGPASDLLIRQDATTGGATLTTLYLPGEEATYDGTTTTATRYYTHAGQVIAARTSPTPGNVAWLLPDHQGTATETVSTADATNQTYAQRYYTPYGTPRGGTVTFPGTRGYIGGTTDTTTGLTNLGAREYNPATPAFTSPDPVLDPYQPTDLNPYSYTAGNPVASEDPTGLTQCDAGYCPTQQQTNQVDNRPENTAAGGCPSYLPGCTGNTPVTTVGTIVLPTRYPHLQQIQQIYNQMYQGGVRQHLWNTSPESMYRALFLACESNQSVCGSTLMNALYHGGETGTAMGKQDYAAWQHSGLSESAWLVAHGNQLIWQNSVAIGMTVGLRSIGHYPEYVDLARKMGAKYFSIPDDIWSSMSPGEQWAANQKFMDRGIAQGDTFLLATPVDDMRIPSDYETELEYLMVNDYTFTDLGDAMIPER